MPPNHQHPDAHHAYIFPEAKASDPHGRELDAWLGNALGAKEPDPAPILHDV